MGLLLKNGMVLENSNEVRKDIFIEDGVIAEIADSIEREGEEMIDCTGMLITPGFVDVHVHLREPGGEHKETIETGTLAAARGGFTAICPMPNTRPVPDNVETLANIQDRIKETAHVKVLPYASITERQLGRDLVDFRGLKQGGAFAFTDDGVGVQSADMMLQAMLEAKKVDMPVVAHTEENTLIHGGAIHEGETSRRLKIPGIPSVAESVHIARDILLAEAAGCHYHVCHVSTKESVRIIRDAKRAGVHVTAEVTPHHLVLDENDITGDDPNFKMNPPLRGSDDREALIAGLLDGTIDLIATDHAPHAEEEKAVGIETAPFGITGSENAFQLLYTKLVKNGTFTLQQLVDWLTVRPSETFNMGMGVLAEGRAADITVIDLGKTYTLDKEKFYSKARNTPFHGMELESDIHMTIVDGKVAYKEEA
ncbi:dihydroorotase [Salinicoccus sp. ID82-1]|uniref:dihydroorotase n=1 Tax=Salinicoccus sp. ID82-1 TaxID=2820269 RepID=UPI001F017660|nr:dihydroorotase [Salinicoccus sp. ID82-1]MCG1008655.1 dihydroorotase [Salinicoccus sp. ID82-1]